MFHLRCAPASSSALWVPTDRAKPLFSVSSTGSSSPTAGRSCSANTRSRQFSRTAIARRIAFVPQDNSIQFPFTVAEIVLMGRAPHSGGMAFENAHDRDVAREMMRLTDVEGFADQPVTNLSGGERQRVFIARALAQQPEIILLDEPNAHLDIAHQVDMFRIIKRLNTESGLTVLSVSHDLNLAAAYSDRIAMMVGGTLAALGTPAEVLTDARIHDVFRTPVIVDTHPVHGTPRVSLLG
jgi:iron complex transport system ATP-binding protein